MKTHLSKLFTSFITAALLVFGATAVAHEGEDHGAGDKVKGTIKSLSDKALVITTTEGKDVTLDVMEMTKFERGGKATTAADVSVGEKVVVTAMKGDSGAHAMLVKLGKKVAAKSAPMGAMDMKSTANGGHAGTKTHHTGSDAGMPHHRDPKK